MWCLRARRLISAFLDRELDSGTSTTLSDHIGWCRWCRKEVERVERGAKLAQKARGVPIPPPPRDMVEQIAKLPGGSNSSSRKHFPILVTLGAAALVLLTLSISNFNIPGIWPSGLNSTVYALDFGFKDPKPGEDLLAAFRARYAGKFREFSHTGAPNASWVPFRFKFPTRLPEGMSLRNVMIFDPRYCGSLGLIFSDGTRNLYLVQQPADRPISLTGLKTTRNEVCKYKSTRCAVGPYRIVTWTAENIRSVLMSNLDTKQIESTMESLQYQR